MVINRVQPLSLAKIAAVLYAAIGLLMGIVLGLYVTTGPFVNAAAPGFPFGMMFGGAAIVIMPIMYACLGFIGSLIMAFLYNAVAGVVGGIELDVE